MTDNGPQSRLPQQQQQEEKQQQQQRAATMAKQNEYLKIWKHIKWRIEK